MQITKLLPYVLPHVQGCPDPFAEQAIRDSADEFCRCSRVLREFAEPISVVPGESDYELLSETPGMLAFDVAFVRFNNQPLTSSVPELQHRLSRNGNGKTRFYTVPTPGIIRLIAPPDCAGTLELVLILRPGNSATSLPDAFCEEWKEGIVSGAISRLCATPNQSFSNGELSAYHQQRFEVETGRASSRAVLGNTRATLRVQAHP